MWWHRCDSLKCLLCLWKGLWTNECELLATPAYKRCICVRQRKGPTSGMGDGASAFGMWCLGEKGWGWTNAVSLFGKPDLLVTNRQVYPGTKNANPPLSSRHWSFVFSSGEKVCWSACKVFLYASVCQYFHPLFLSVTTPSPFFPPSFSSL